MGKQRKRTTRKGKRKQHAKQRDRVIFRKTSYQDEISDNETQSDGESSHLHCSARAVNCLTCLKPKQSTSAVEEIMDILRTSKPTMESIRNSLQLLNILVDNYEPPIDEIRYEGLDIILIEGMQFKNVYIQYYAIHALSVIAKCMKEEQLRSLISRGLKQGITAVLKRDVFLIVQEGIEACSNIVVKSSVLRDYIAACDSLRVTQLLVCEHYREMSLEFIRSVAFFLRNLCYHKPIPEFILRSVASSARFFLLHEDEKIRSVVLDVVFEVVSNEDSIITFENSYVEIILQFFDSAIEDEARAAFFIVGYFVKQHSNNTDTLLRMGLIKKIMPLLERHSAPEFDFEACLILKNLLSQKKYIKHVGSIVNSGLVLLLLELLDEGAPNFKDEACVTLRLLNEIWKPRQAIKVANPQHIKIMCNILKSSNNEHIACSIALIHSLLKACSDLQAYFQLQQAKALLKESNAYEYIVEFIELTSQNILINQLACEMRTLYLDVETDSDENSRAEREALHIQSSGYLTTEICVVAEASDAQMKISHSND
ncbi:Importin subunit [Dirofilaria immitis]